MTEDRDVKQITRQFLASHEEGEKPIRDTSKRSDAVAEAATGVFVFLLKLVICILVLGLVLCVVPISTFILAHPLGSILVILPFVILCKYIKSIEEGRWD